MIYTERRRLLSNQFADLLHAIRSLEGFEQFLRGPAERELQKLATHGPIVVFNVSDVRSDAFIVESEGIHSLPLRALTQKDLEDNSERLINSVTSQGWRYASANAELRKLLEWLWDVAVGPVLEKLGLTRT